MENLKYCSNILKCIGTISEIRADFVKEQDNIMLKCFLTVKSKDKIMKFNLFSNKKYNNNINMKYYDILEVLGIQHSFFTDIDKDKYSLSEDMLQVGMCGILNIKDGNNIINSISLKSSTTPTRVFIISSINEYGNQISYMSRTQSDDYINIQIQGVPYILNKDYLDIIIVSKESNILRFDYDIGLYNRIKSIPVGTLCNFYIEYDKGYKLDNDIVFDVYKSRYVIKNIKEDIYIYDRNKIERIIREWKILNKK